MTADQKTRLIQMRFERAGITASWDQVNTLRRAELTLHRWYELECGDGDTYASWYVVRNEVTGKPFMERHYHRAGDKWGHSLTPVPDRETGAINRIKAICKDLEINYYIQSDPRGCALYVSKDTLTASTYSRGIAVCI